MAEKTLLSQTQKLSVKPSINARLINGISMLAMNLDDLNDHVKATVEENPFLDFPHDFYSPVDPQMFTRNRRVKEEQLEPEDSIGKTWRQSDAWAPGSKKNDLFERLPDYDNPFESLQEYLWSQITFAGALKTLEGPCEVIIDSLDANGYFRCDIDLLEKNCGYTRAELEQALHMVQQLDPPGIGARTVKECLLLQLRNTPPHEAHSELAAHMIMGDLNEIASGNVSFLAKKYQQPKDLIERCIETIKSLEPYPAQGLAKGVTHYSVPDIVIEKRQGSFILKIAGDDLETITFDKASYECLLKQKPDSKTLEYMKNKRDEAACLVSSIAARNSFMRKMTLFLMTEQAEFFEYGPARLRGLSMTQAAHALGTSVSTISRVANNKTIQTPWGTMPIKKFFDRGGIEANGNETVSATRIKELVKLFVKDEPKDKPYDDAHLASLVQRQTGANVARRTIAKYRGELGIPNKAKRRTRI